MIFRIIWQYELTFIKSIVKEIWRNFCNKWYDCTMKKIGKEDWMSIKCNYDEVRSIIRIILKLIPNITCIFYARVSAIFYPNLLFIITKSWSHPFKYHIHRRGWWKTRIAVNERSFARVRQGGEKRREEELAPPKEANLDDWKTRVFISGHV